MKKTLSSRCYTSRGGGGVRQWNTKKKGLGEKMTSFALRAIYEFYRVIHNQNRRIIVNPDILAYVLEGSTESPSGSKSPSLVCINTIVKEEKDLIVLFAFDLR